MHQHRVDLIKRSGVIDGPIWDVYLDLEQVLMSTDKLRDAIAAARWYSSEMPASLHGTDLPKELTQQSEMPEAEPRDPTKPNPFQRTIPITGTRITSAGPTKRELASAAAAKRRAEADKRRAEGLALGLEGMGL